MALLSDHRRDLDNLNTVAVSETVALLEQLKDSPVPELAYYLRENLPAIADTYSAVAEELAIDYYDSSRQEAGVISEYRASRSPDYDFDTPIQSGIGYGIANITKGSEWEAFLGVITGTMQRTVTGADRATISWNIVTDPDGTFYERVPSGTACAFCLTMAAVAEYQTSDYFSKFHDNCRCTSRPVFVGQSRTELPIYDSVREAYYEANGQLQARREVIEPIWREQWRAAGGRMGKNLTRDFLRAYPELAYTTENHLRIMRDITGWR